jgi:type VI secretion system protein ImpK
MSSNQTISVDRRANLAMAFQELFTAIVRLRFSRQSAPNAEVFRSHMRDAYRLAAQDAQAKGYTPRAVQKAGYAVIAFLDESVVSSRNSVFANWSLSPMQKELFPEVSGETFFHTVDELLAAPDSPEDADTLEVSLLALLLGYRGRYAIGSADELATIMQKMTEKIARVRQSDSVLSPSWAIPAEQIVPPPPNPVRKTFTALAASALAASVVAFVLCKILLLSGASEIHSLLQR